MNESKYVWDKPLPDHTKKDYYECYAKVVLEEIFNKIFFDLKIEDKPDLQSDDEKLGIEVTRAEDAKEIEAEKMYSKISYGGCRNVKKVLDKYSDGNIRIENGMLFSSGVDSFDLVLEAFKEKLNKLNYGDYKEFEENYLFVFSDILADKAMMKKALKDMIEFQTDKNKKFKVLYVLVPGACYTFNLHLIKYEEHKITSKQQYLHSCKARELVERYEQGQVLLV